MFEQIGTDPKYRLYGNILRKPVEFLIQMTAKLSAKSVSVLLKENEEAISLLKDFICTQNFPDLSSSPVTFSPLSSSLKVDDLFYLRYVLSAKTPINNETILSSHPTVKHLMEALIWRNSFENMSSDLNPEADALEESILEKIPMARTGTLWNGFPVVVLPFNKIDFDWIFDQIVNNSTEFETSLLMFFLRQKERMFLELDEETRKTGNLIKSITVYDLNGMSFSSIYKLTKFLKVMQKQQKKVKAYFPQSTHSTVVLNSPGQWVLKSFSTSSKQKVMSESSFLDEYDARQAVPDFLGGYVSWNDLTSNQLKNKFHQDITADEIKKIEPKMPLNESTGYADLENKVGAESPVQEAWVPGVKKNKKKLKRVDLGVFERDCIPMKKNKLFSLTVLEPNQTINIFFTNMKHKDAHVLFAMKGLEEECKWQFAGSQGSKRINPGLNHYQMRVAKPCEVVLVYVDTQVYKKVGDDFDLESVYLKVKGSTKRRVKKMGKKILKTKTSSSNEKSKKKRKSYTYLFSAAVDKEEELAGRELYFKFDVTKSVVPGTFGGFNHDSLDNLSELGVEINTKEKNARKSMTVRRLKRQETMKVLESDTRSIFSTESRRPQDEQIPSFFSAVGQILGF
eukprot:augustus_masked-scaffold_1-processed-gene-30.6-mRNA-1 protein AED:1.00 eAED:1.00 QI:0/-1/0/0/-1/1/1/0/623